MTFQTIVAKLLLTTSLIGYNADPSLLYDMSPLKGKVVCIDAGHGGQDPWTPCYKQGLYTGGTYGIVTKQSESDVNLKVAIYLKQYLEMLGAKRVVLTRETSCRLTDSQSKTCELSIRPEIAAQNNADYFISIHHNDGKNKAVNYSCVFYNKNNQEQSKKMSDWILMTLGQQMCIPTIKSNVGNFTVLNHAKMPAILVEASFLSNPDEDCRLFSYGYDAKGYVLWGRCQQEAFAVAKGLSMYVLTEKYSINLSPNIVSDKIENVKEKIVTKSKKLFKKTKTKKNKRH